MESWCATPILNRLNRPKRLEKAELGDTASRSQLTARHCEAAAALVVGRVAGQQHAICHHVSGHNGL